MAICPGGQKWLHNPSPHASGVLGCDRCLKWAQLWSHQPRKWPKRLKNEWKWPYYGFLIAIRVVLWRRDSYNMNIYWHPWFGAIFTTFGYLEVSFADNSFIVLRMSWKEPAPLSQINSCGLYFWDIYSVIRWALRNMSFDRSYVELHCVV